MVRASQAGMLQASSVPASRSILTKSRLATKRVPVMPVATREVATRTGGRNFSGRKVKLERARRRPLRAASAAPRSVIQRVMCWTSTMEPGIPLPSSARPMTSMMGRIAIRLRMSSERESSNQLRRGRGAACRISLIVRSEFIAQPPDLVEKIGRAIASPELRISLLGFFLPNLQFSLI